MRYTVLFCSKTGAKSVKPGQARSGSHARRPTPRRLSVFYSTILNIRISHTHAKPAFAKNRHSANNRPRQAGAVQCLNEMPLDKPGDCAPARRSSARTNSVVSQEPINALSDQEPAVVGTIPCNPNRSRSGLKSSVPASFSMPCVITAILCISQCRTLPF